MKKMVLTMMMALLTTVGTSSVTNAAAEKSFDTSGVTNAVETSFDTSTVANFDDIERVDATSMFPPYSEIVNTDSILAKLTEEEYYETLRNSIPMEHFKADSSEFGTKQVSPRAAIMSWSFADVSRSAYSNKFSVTNFGGGSKVSLRITVVQWASDGSNKAPTMYYGLVNANYRGEPVTIVGKYTHTNTYDDVYVPEGTYEVQITNGSSFNVTGNGNIAYF